MSDELVNCGSCGKWQVMSLPSLHFSFHSLHSLLHFFPPLLLVFNTHGLYTPQRWHQCMHHACNEYIYIIWLYNNAYWKIYDIHKFQFYHMISFYIYGTVCDGNSVCWHTLFTIVVSLSMNIRLPNTIKLLNVNTKVVTDSNFWFHTSVYSVLMNTLPF